MSKKAAKGSLVPSAPGSLSPLIGLISGKRKGVFEQGYDKLGRPYQKKLDDKGVYIKEEVLKDETPNLTIKILK